MVSKKKETGLLLQISRDGKSISVLNELIEKEAAQARIMEMAREGIDAKYFPEKSVDEFQQAIDRLNTDLKKHRQPMVKIVPDPKAI